MASFSQSENREEKKRYATDFPLRPPRGPLNPANRSLRRGYVRTSYIHHPSYPAPHGQPHAWHAPLQCSGLTRSKFNCPLKLRLRSTGSRATSKAPRRAVRFYDLSISRPFVARGESTRENGNFARGGGEIGKFINRRVRSQ